MPQPPAALLVEVPEPREPRLSEALARAEETLPLSDSFRDVARELVRGKRPAASDVLWPSRIVAQSVGIVQQGLRAEGGRWPRRPGGPRCDLTRMARLGDALLVTAYSYRVVGAADKEVDLCLDILGLAAHIAAAAGPEPEMSAQSMEAPAVAELQGLVREVRLGRAVLQRLLSDLQQQRGRVKPLDQVLREGLSIAARTAREMSPDDWAGAVRQLWAREPHRDVARAMSEVWEKWSILIEASRALPAQAQEMTKGLTYRRDEMDVLFGPPPASIIQRRATLERERSRLLLMVALEWWRVNRGRYPDRLGELCPQALPNLPHDPWTGRPFLYRRLGPRYTLRSASDAAPGRVAAEVSGGRIPSGPR